MIAYIPARGGSKRVPRKNVRELGGKPVIGHVINELKQLGFIEGIFVSTDDAEIADISIGCGAEVGELRDPDLSGDYVMFRDLIQKDLPRFLSRASEKSRFLFAFATSALITTEVYRKAYQKFEETRADALISVNVFDPSPFRALMPNKDGFLKAAFPEQIKMRTQDMPPCYVDAGCFYYLDYERIAGLPTFLEAETTFFEVSPDSAIDVDTPEDWARLERALIARSKP